MHRFLEFAKFPDSDVTYRKAFRMFGPEPAETPVLRIGLDDFVEKAYEWFSRDTVNAYRALLSYMRYGIGDDWRKFAAPFMKRAGLKPDDID